MSRTDTTPLGVRVLNTQPKNVVYVVQNVVDYEGDYLVGLYATADAAQAASEKYAKEHYVDDSQGSRMMISQMTVQGGR